MPELTRSLTDQLVSNLPTKKHIQIYTDRHHSHLKLQVRPSGRKSYYFGAKCNGKTIREIKIAITRVINIKRETQYQSLKSTPEYEYIGRGAYWGNPYSMYEDGDRDEVIRKFKYDFDYEKFLNVDKAEVYKLAGKRLGCYCKPQACHGDVLADYLNAWDDGK